MALLEFLAMVPSVGSNQRSIMPYHMVLGYLTVPCQILCSRYWNLSERIYQKRTQIIGYQDFEAALLDKTSNNYS